MYKDNLTKLKNEYHSDCIYNSEIYNLKTTFNPHGELIASFICNEQNQGYTGRIHGGVLSGLMDSAMTQCLFGHNIVAYTVRLNIKYSHPVPINKEAIIKVKLINKQNDQIYNISGSISQDDRELISAKAKFWIVKDFN